MSEVIKKQRTLNRFWFIWNLIEAFVLLAGGVLAIVAGIMTDRNGTPDPMIENTVAYVVAAFIILDGVLRVVMYLSRYKQGEEQSPLVIAGFEISIGVLFVLLQSKFTQEHIFTYTIVNLIAIVLMVMGLLLLVYAIYFIAKKLAKLFMPVVEILFAAILAGVGIVIEVLYNTSETRDQLVLILTGSILCIAAVGMFIISLVSRSKNKKVLDQAEAEERGDFGVAKEPLQEKAEPPVQQAEIVDVEEVQPEPKQKLKGPRAIENKKE